MTRNSVKRYSALVEASSAMAGGGVPSIFERGMTKIVNAIGRSQKSLFLRGPVKKAISVSAIMNGSVKLISFVFMAHTAASTETARKKMDGRPIPHTIALIYATAERR